jgi:hypothetical protein
MLTRIIIEITPLCQKLPSFIALCCSFYHGLVLLSLHCAFSWKLNYRTEISFKITIPRKIERNESQKNAKNDKIENVAGTI